MAGSGELESIEVGGDKLTVLSNSGETFESRKEQGSSIVELLEAAEIDPLVSRTDITVKGSSGMSSFFGLILNFLPLIIFGTILLFMIRINRSVFENISDFFELELCVRIGKHL